MGKRKRDMGTRWLAVAGACVLTLAACGSGGSGDTEDFIDRVADAVEEPGMVYHAAGDDGSEVWIDAQRQLFRRREPTADGSLVSVGDGWQRVRYDPFENEALEESTEPQGEARPRIDHPMVAWLEALAALGYGRELELIGDTMADGEQVVALEARTPVFSEGVESGFTLVGRVEVDAKTYLPFAFERSEMAPEGATPTQERTRVRYTTSELVPREELPDGFFDPSIVQEQVLTTEESVAEISELGLTPYWLGEGYESQLGELQLPPKDAVFTNPQDGTAELHYALIAGEGENAEPLLEAVVVRLGNDPLAFTPPTLPEVGGNLPEDSKEIEVRDGMGTLFTSLLSPSDLGCPEGEPCPETQARVYRRLVFMIGETAVQIETFARVGATGDDLNGYNTEFGITALADTIMEVTEEVE